MDAAGYTANTAIYDGNGGRDGEHHLERPEKSAQDSLRTPFFTSVRSRKTRKFAILFILLYRQLHNLQDCSFVGARSPAVRQSQLLEF